MNPTRFGLRLTLVVGLCSALLAAMPAGAKDKKKAAPAKGDPYADYVWPSPPDPPRIKLDTVIVGRADIEGESKLAKALIGVSPKTKWDDFIKPFGVDFDPQGRVLITDTGSAGLIRIDLAESRWDILGTKGALPLKAPLGLGVGKDGTIYVADVGLQKVVAFTADGKTKAVYGKAGELANPTDAAPSPDGRRLFVSDSKAHKIVIYDLEKATVITSWGKPGGGDGELQFPTSLAFGPDGQLFVVDQLNARVQIFGADGEFIDKLGQLGTSFGSFVRPKDVAVDELGLIYVSDTAFNNFQIFDVDFRLLTFVGQGGERPGQFLGASGIAVRGDRIAVVDQLGHRLQLFHFVAAKGAR